MSGRCRAPFDRLRFIIGAMVNYMGGPAVSQALLYGVAVIPGALCIGTLGFSYLAIRESIKIKIYEK